MPFACVRALFHLFCVCIFLLHVQVAEGGFHPIFGSRFHKAQYVERIQAEQIRIAERDVVRQFDQVVHVITYLFIDSILVFRIDPVAVRHTEEIIVRYFVKNRHVFFRFEAEFVFFNQFHPVFAFGVIDNTDIHDRFHIRDEEIACFPFQLPFGFGEIHLCAVFGIGIHVKAQDFGQGRFLIIVFVFFKCEPIELFGIFHLFFLSGKIHQISHDFQFLQRRRG